MLGGITGAASVPSKFLIFLENLSGTELPDVG
jgi:hypothetical protein